MGEIALELVKDHKPIPADDALGFGKVFTDHMFVMDYEEGKGWINPRIVPFSSVTMSTAAAVLHYGQAIFEGIKAFRTKDGQVAIYRALDHLKRLNNSAKYVCIPEMDVDILHKGLKKLIEVEKNWVPKSKGTSLYIRPFVFATESYLGVKVAGKYSCYIILSPVGSYYSAGFSPIRIKVEDYYVRAIKGGLGEAKTSSNYAASLAASNQAQKEGFTQVLWLDGVEKKYVEEVGTMNIFFVIGDELVTPALNGSFLNGITRQSILKLAPTLGLKAVERRIPIEELFEAHAKGELKEVFGSGTAAVISPVGELSYKGKNIVINDNKVGPVAQLLFDQITGIQQGLVEDKFNWLDFI
ncbi:branched-chain amino acid aminotransferase [Selenomonadales bacterium OttesenSCG-928-I06]|nr:branched-chain amino acid aminotransferase [Selenomonadales bacterium OttesenSCG-928-I06]